MKKLVHLINCVLFTITLSAQKSKEEFFKEAVDTLADLISFPFQNNLNINYGPYNRNVIVLNIQPAIPLAVGKIITRTILPFSLQKSEPLLWLWIWITKKAMKL